MRTSYVVFNGSMTPWVVAFLLRKSLRNYFIRENQICRACQADRPHRWPVTENVLSCRDGRRMHFPVVYHLVPADRTLTNIHAIKQDHKICYPFPLYGGSEINGSTESMDMFQFFCFPAIREISAEPDSVEAFWQYMLQEKSNVTNIFTELMQ